MTDEVIIPQIYNYVIVNSDGEFNRTIKCTEEQSLVQAQPGETIIQTEIDTYNTHYYSNGNIVEYDNAIKLIKQNRPSWTPGWSNATMSWIDPRNLAQKQLHKWEEIKEIRAQKEFGSFTWDNSEFDADSESQRRIQGAAQLAMIAASASQPFEIDWTLADNTVRTLSGADMISVGLALGTHVATQYEIARTLRTAIEATTTEEELNAITWPT